ncbi:MAG: hypothetical protein M5R40_06710 [Anaerolineae bacterium]|nr:hypothetical protein [Anaerolineae bacterium]
MLAFYQEHGAKQWPKVKINDHHPATGRQPRSVDIAMFGRMTTSEAFEDVAAAVQGWLTHHPPTRWFCEF